MAPRTVLLVVDMQVFFAPMATDALPNIVKLCTYFTKASAPIIFTQHGHSEYELTTKPSPSQLVRRWGPQNSIATGSPDWEIIHELRQFVSKFPPPEAVVDVGESYPPSQDEQFPKLMPKNTYDAFINTNLSTILEAAKIERVVVCGVMSDVCCGTTARSAFNRGYETWLVSDATGSATQSQHLAGLKSYGFAYGEVLKTREVLARLKE
ncbi:hypothetical protein PV08_01801 [Exophiala spinifera]|uniref:Isochorismatase-like domain-containing protein n=1 Tax=Exophiala spinifera TaxID=91928 RepID=A0A0D1Z0R8_9EURO|nr:uncharacterized protein PV08_01801 [Exophiala spinifera]KIW21221.1 hypothetical protein PV08_01801 [Exophiala spinifera]